VKRFLVLTATFVLLLALPAAQAGAYGGSLAAEGIYVQGEFQVDGKPLLARIGGTGTSFNQPPQLMLTAEQVLAVHHAYYLVGASPLGVQTTRFVDPHRSHHESHGLQDATLVLGSWLTRDSEIVVESIAAAIGTTARLEGRAEAPAAVGTLSETVRWRVGPDSGELNVNGVQPLLYEATSGHLGFLGPAFGHRLEVIGDFDLVLYGADFRLHGQGGPRDFQTGERLASSGVAGVSRDAWYNYTVLHVSGGHLTLDPRGNAMAAYAPEAKLAGRGSLLFVDASGHVQPVGDSAHGVNERDLNLVGTFELALRGSDRRVLATFNGDFDAEAMGLSTGAVPSAGPAWWWLPLVGLAAVGGAGSLLVLRRRKAPATVPVPVDPLAAARAAADIIPDARPMDPGLTWDDLSEEFGIVRAGEKAGVLIVLVPEDKVQNFLEAVVKRGLMAEDTGDRVHAAEHTLAVVALEPSPVMMN
jgi:hypothetical protein